MYLYIYVFIYVYIYLFIYLFRPEFLGVKLESKTYKAIHCCESAESKQST